MAKEIGQGVREFQRKVCAHLAEHWGVTYGEARERLIEWLKAHPNPNGRERREYRLTRHATAKDAQFHAALLKKRGGVDVGLGEYVSDIGLWNQKDRQWDRKRVVWETQHEEEKRAISEDVPWYVSG